MRRTAKFEPTDAPQSTICGVMSRLFIRVERTLLILLGLVAACPCSGQNQNEPLVIVQDGKYGYINHAGGITIRPQFIWAEDFWHGLAEAYVCGRYVSIDRSGAVHPDRVPATDNLRPKEKDNQFGFVNGSGAFQIAPIFDEVLPFSEGLAAVRIGEKWGFVNTSGHVVIKPQFESAFYFREGVGLVKMSSGDALIDKAGKVIASGLDYVDFIADARVPARRGDKSGYLDLRGAVAIPFIYDGVDRFSDGLAAVEKNEKWGYLDREGHMIIQPQFDQAGPFASGLAPVKVGATSGFIDRSGRFAFLLAFEQAPGFLTGDEKSNLFIAPSDVSRFWTADGRFGYVNTSGRVIWGPNHGSPDHPPLLGWSDEDKVRSCDGIPKETRDMIAAFPEH